MDDGQVMEGAADGVGLSRRALIGGLGAAGALGLAGAVAGGAPVVAAAEVADAIEAPTPGLVYLPLDAFAFDSPARATARTASTRSAPGCSRTRPRPRSSRRCRSRSGRS